MTSVLECRDLNRVFATAAGAVEALRSATFSVERGQMVAIMGPSGSGKSTLLQLLGLMDRATHGEYHLLGKPVNDLTDSQRSRLRAEYLGFVFQSFHLIEHRSAADNVGLPLAYQRIARKERQHRAREMLAQVGMGHRLNAFPPTLSGGERQRVAIGRALVHRPAALMCDEPTGSLDSANAERVVELLHGAAHQGVAVVLVTHDPAVAARADDSFVIKDGVLAPPRLTGGLG